MPGVTCELCLEGWGGLDGGMAVPGTQNTSPASSVAVVPKQGADIIIGTAFKRKGCLSPLLPTPGDASVQWGLPTPAPRSFYYLETETFLATTFFHQPILVTLGSHILLNVQVLDPVKSFVFFCIPDKRFFVSLTGRLLTAVWFIVLLLH